MMNVLTQMLTTDAMFDRQTRTCYGLAVCLYPIKTQVLNALGQSQLRLQTL